MSQPQDVVKPQEKDVMTWDQRLDKVVEEGPPSKDEQTKSFLSQMKRLCFSKIGLAFLAFVVVFLLLLFLQPAYIYKKNGAHAFGFKYINFALVTALSAIAALLVLVIPYFVTKK